MYCKNCGKEIENNSKFCPHCGNKITTINNSSSTEREKDGFSIFKVLLIPFIIFIALITILGIAFGVTNSNKSSSNNDKNNIFSRNATLNDVNIVWQKNTLNIQGTVIPKDDIDNLIITFKFYNKENLIVKTIEKRFGDVTKDQSYEFTIALSEIGSDAIFTSEGVKYNVTSGQIKYLG